MKDNSSYENDLAKSIKNIDLEEEDEPPVGKLVKKNSLAQKIQNPNYKRTDREKIIEEKVNYVEQLLHEKEENRLNRVYSLRTGPFVIKPGYEKNRNTSTSLIKKISNVASAEEILGEPNRRMSLIEKQYLNDMVKEAMSNQILLEKEWTFWLDTNTKKGTEKTDFMKTLQNLQSFKSSTEFSYILMTYCDYLININELTVKLNNRLFQTGITPIREDPQNEYGGQYIAMLPKSRTEVQKIWFKSLVALIMGKLDEVGEVTGIVLSLRRKSDSLSIWVKTRCHFKISDSNKQHIRDQIGLPPNSKITYNNHKIGHGTKWGNDKSSKHMAKTVHDEFKLPYSSFPASPASISAVRSHYKGESSLRNSTKVPLLTVTRDDVQSTGNNGRRSKNNNAYSSEPIEGGYERRQRANSFNKMLPNGPNGWQQSPSRSRTNSFCKSHDSKKRNN